MLANEYATEAGACPVSAVTPRGCLSIYRETAAVYDRLPQLNEVIAMNDVFNTLLELESNDPEFARAYAAESARIEAIDSMRNALD